MYILYSYIKSYNDIVDELKKIRLKCIQKKVKKEKNIYNKNKQQGDYKITRIISSLSEENQEEEEKHEEENLEEDLQEENNTSTENRYKNNYRNINYNEKNKNNVENGNTIVLNNFDRYLEESNQNHINSDNVIISNNMESNQIENFENFENFEKEKQLEYWKPFKEDINKISEGFVQSPYKGYNKDLYEPLIINSNSVNTRGLKKNTNIYQNKKQLGW